MIGQYKSTAEEQYFPYVRPQENGHHCDTRWISLGGKGKNLLIVADDEMEFNAMRNSVEDFDAGKATDRPYQWNNFTPEEIAKAIAFLALEDSAFTTGQVLSPNGGLVI